jgi:hypothetical protein
MLKKVAEFGKKSATGAPGYGSETFEAVLGRYRRPYFDNSELPRQRHLSYLLRCVTKLEHFDGATKFLRHMQHAQVELSEVVADEFIYASLRLDRPDLSLRFLHRSPVDRKLKDEEPFYRMFPRPKSYTRLMQAFMEKKDCDRALQTFSIFTAQDRDMMTSRVDATAWLGPSVTKSRAAAFYYGMKANRLAGKFDVVRSIYEEARHRHVEMDPRALNILVDVAVEKGEHQLAETLFAQICEAFGCPSDGSGELDPRVNEACAHVARSYHAQQQHAVAEQYLARIAGKFRQSPTIQAIERCMIDEQEQEQVEVQVEKEEENKEEEEKE